ncbi:FG-GAP-like repeat-containing protein [Streptomyces justiciae]|uniref:FG-GAP-like repeat-containing protein n=1 Tax=Streptomyces justiciae TaxID=2780140 RepID=UPI0018805D22|nr:FG-GAP-like repeat-containing protein [Streptomyces justiciae]MBE8474458.1 FG-GAP repeat protein [Streptomyces justiciae]
MFSLRTYGRWAVPLAAGLLSLGALPTTAEASAPAPVRDDFDGDGYQDLAVGAPGGTVGGQPDAGYVVVMYGGPHGLTKDRRTVISRATTGVPGSPAKGEKFGIQLTKGDLDGDGRADLVVGHVSATRSAVVVWGAKGGLTGGTALPASTTQAGDFDGDGKLDLALFKGGRAQGDDPLGTTATVWKGPLTRTGRPAAARDLDPAGLRYVDVWDGATGDVNADGRDELALKVYCGDGSYCTRFYVGSPTGPAPAAGGTFPGGGGGMAIGDFDGDGYGDLAVGNAPDSSVTVAAGSASGLAPSSTWRRFTQDTPGVPGAYEDVDFFGTSVSAADINGDGRADLAVGAPGEEIGYDDGAGIVDVLYGTEAGLTGTGAQAFTQNTAGVPGAAEPGDAFGGAVRLLDINGNGHADLAASAVGENSRAGAVWSLRGRSTGVVTDAAFVFGARTVGAPDAKAGFGREVE